jgi:hypothetical protein
MRDRGKKDEEGEYGWSISYVRMNIEIKPVEITIRRGQWWQEKNRMNQFGL